MKIKENILSVLKNGIIEGNTFTLTGQLDRKTYLETNEILETIGLKWNKKAKKHIFDGEGLQEAFDDILETGECETIKETIKKFQFYPTPKEVADYLVELADINESDMVLEPSAGLGNIADEIKIYKTLNLVEFDKSKFDILLEKYSDKLRVDLYNGDFLEYNHKFDKIIANPPFSKSQDVKHILHMYELLHQGGILVSVASSSIQTRQGKLYDELRALNPEFIELPQGSFKESGTMVNTIIVKITKGYYSRN